MTRQTRKFWMALGVFLAATALALPVSASSGTVTGSMTFTQGLQNCASGGGTKFSCTQVGQPQPIRYAYVEVWRKNLTKMLGSNFTDSNGNFVINWADNAVSFSSVDVKILWQAKHQDQRFQVGEWSSPWSFSTAANFSAVNGQSTPIPNLHWNTPHASVYDGATKFWDALKQSNRQFLRFGIQAPECPAGDNSCGPLTKIMISSSGQNESGGAGCSNGNAWAQPKKNFVCLANDSLGHFANLSRLWHELGHIADYVAHRNMEMYWYADYRRDDPAACAGDPDGDITGDGVPDCNLHFLNSNEWHSAQFGEAIASHFATMALYGSSHTSPFFCISSTGPCSSAGGTFSLEAAPSDCNNEHRWEITGQRYFWDAYDTQVDSARGYTDSVSNTQGSFSDALDLFAPGFGNNQRDEVVNSAYVTEDENGHSTLDFREVWGAATDSALRMNCRPQGALNDSN